MTADPSAYIARGAELSVIMPSRALSKAPRRERTQASAGNLAGLRGKPSRVRRSRRRRRSAWPRRPCRDWAGSPGPAPPASWRRRSPGSWADAPWSRRRARQPGPNRRAGAPPPRTRSTHPAAAAVCGCRAARGQPGDIGQGQRQGLADRFGLGLQHPDAEPDRVTAPEAASRVAPLLFSDGGPAARRDGDQRN